MQTILIMFIVFIWMWSMLAIINRWAKNDIPVNIISIAILICPVINTLLAIYYAKPTYKGTLSKIFKNN